MNASGSGHQGENSKRKSPNHVLSSSKQAVSCICFQSREEYLSGWDIFASNFRLILRKHVHHRAMEAFQGGLLCQAADPVPSSLATHITAEQVGYFQAAADHLVVIKEFSSLQSILGHHPSPDQQLLLEVLVTNLFYAASTSSLLVRRRREVEVNKKQSKFLFFCHKMMYLQRFLDVPHLLWWLMPLSTLFPAWWQVTKFGETSNQINAQCWQFRGNKAPKSQWYRVVVLRVIDQYQRGYLCYACDILCEFYF